MNINGLNLPSGLLEAMESRKYCPKIGSIALSDEKDSFGNKLETEIGEMFTTLNQIRNETNNLPERFVSDGVYGEESEYCNEPGFIADLTDFKCIIAFAISSDGSPFCLDYRQNRISPGVVWWDDTYWRKISESIDDFLSLFSTNS